ncbi:SDR family oxidoreductase [Nocardioides bruguierae]|uniref:SDR family oxidoreductase n=1 Tax=Nocardioides bruguierae TaxID=2945102 RepID=UPI00201FF8C5|nr:SDR family oxidoreductase [Nocardioides bruguierae]MCL8024265.1 SDR family oxidoreductase [Nocardioides bruguierae]
MLLQDRVVLVTGATQGLGAGIARAAAREGALVVVSGRDAERGEAVAAGLRADGASAHFVRADVADPAQARDAVAQTVARHGRIDGLVNAAGSTARGTLLDTTPELFDAHVAVNLRGPFFTMQAAVADMVSRGAPGSIVNIISIDSHGGQSFLSPYVAAKAGLVGLTKNAAHAHRWDRVRVNGLNIGWTATDGEHRTQGAGTADDPDGSVWLERAASSVPMGRLGDVDEIADLVVLLLSDRSGVVTGSVIDWDQTVVGGLGLAPGDVPRST